MQCFTMSTLNPYTNKYYCENEHHYVTLRPGEEKDYIDYERIIVEENQMIGQNDIQPIFFGKDESSMWFTCCVSDNDDTNNAGTTCIHNKR